mmetsp:Transcript_31845/g.101457  ORF Transcript_31845/g.101457 Transcript_31845/m.101457 type:complete len:226 (-) Transcript_31845:892-1569(-)
MNGGQLAWKSSPVRMIASPSSSVCRLKFAGLPSGWRLGEIWRMRGEVRPLSCMRRDGVVGSFSFEARRPLRPEGLPLSSRAGRGELGAFSSRSLSRTDTLVTRRPRFSSSPAATRSAFCFFSSAGRRRLIQRPESELTERPTAAEMVLHIAPSERICVILSSSAAVNGLCLSEPSPSSRSSSAACSTGSLAGGVAAPLAPLAGGHTSGSTPLFGGLAKRHGPPLP